jgi:hypothetical protein
MPTLPPGTTPIENAARAIYGVGPVYRTRFQAHDCQSPTSLYLYQDPQNRGHQY